MMKQQLHFSHANGIPASTYSYLFEMLEGVQVCFVEKMGLGAFPLNGDWANLVDELIGAIERQDNGPVVGMGHSAGGAVTFLAAAKRPDLFKQLILLDPVLFSRRKRAVLEGFRRIGLGDVLGPTKRALQRRAQFDNAQQARQYFTSKTLFKHFHPRCFDDYLKHGLVATTKRNRRGIELAIPPQHEASIFRSVATKLPKGLDQVKGVIIYGDKSNLYWRSDIRWWHRHLPHFDIVSILGGHMFPLENPENVAEMVNRYLQD